MMAEMLQSLQIANVRANSQSDVIENAVDRLAGEVNAKQQVNIDAEEVAAMVGRTIVEEVQQAVTPQLDAMSAHVGHELHSLTKPLSAEVTSFERSVARFEKANEASMGRWAQVSHVLLALLPFAVVVIIVGSLVGSFGSMVGVGPLLGWAWSSFANASEWWRKLTIAVAALGSVAVFVALVGWVGKKLHNHYKGW
jgi:hypothetical protein